MPEMTKHLRRAQLLEERTKNLSAEEALELSKIITKSGYERHTREELIERIHYLLWCNHMPLKTRKALRKEMEALISSKYV